MKIIIAIILCFLLCSCDVTDEDNFIVKTTLLGFDVSDGKGVSDFTIEFDVKFYSLKSHGICWRGENGRSTGYGVKIGKTWLRLYTGDGRQTRYYEFPFTMEVGRWYHIRYAVSNDRLEVYVDGKNIGTTNIASPVLDGEFKFLECPSDSMGRWATTTMYYLDGELKNYRGI